MQWETNSVTTWLISTCKLYLQSVQLSLSILTMFSAIFSHWSGAEKLLRMTWNGQFWLTHNFSNLLLLKCSAQNGQFHLIHSFSNLFPLKWLKMNQNSQFHLIHNLSTFSHQSGSEWKGMANFTQFTTFQILSHWSDSEWLRMDNFVCLQFSNLFPTK